MQLIAEAYDILKRGLVWGQCLQGGYLARVSTRVIIVKRIAGRRLVIVIQEPQKSSRARFRRIIHWTEEVQNVEVDVGRKVCLGDGLVVDEEIQYHIIRIFGGQY